MLEDDDDEDYKIYKINHQFQSFSNKILLPLNEYLEEIRPELINLMSKNYEVELNVNIVLGSKNNPNDECNMFIKTRSANSHEVFDQLIEKHEDLKSTNLVLKGVESITYSFIKIIIKKYLFNL